MKALWANQSRQTQAVASNVREELDTNSDIAAHIIHNERYRCLAKQQKHKKVARGPLWSILRFKGLFGLHPL